MSTSTRRGSNGVSIDYNISLDCILFLVNRTLKSLHKDKNMVGHVGKQRMKGL